MSDAIESLLAQGLEARREHRHADAKRVYAEAVDLCRGSDHPVLLIHSLKRLGGIERDLGDTETALQHYKEATSLCRTLNDPLLLAHTIRHVADIQRELRMLADAESNYAEALSIYRSNPQTNTLDLANTLRGYALLQSALERRTEAIALWQEAGHLYNQVWQEPGSPFTQSDLAPGIVESQRQVALLSAS